MAPLNTDSTNTDGMSEFAYSWSLDEIFEGVLPEVIRFFHSKEHLQSIKLIPDRSKVMVKDNGDTFCLLCVQCNNREYYIYCPYRPSGEMLQVGFDTIDFLEPDLIFELREKGILPHLKNPS